MTGLIRGERGGVKKFSGDMISVTVSLSLSARGGFYH